MEAVETYRARRVRKPSLARQVCIVLGLTLMLAGSVAAALVLIPDEIHNTVARVWIAIALFGATVASIAGLLKYSARAFWPERHYKSHRARRDSLVAEIGQVLDEDVTVRAAVLFAAMRYMEKDDAARYAVEWAAHLDQLVEEGELEQARRDRRRLALAAVLLAIRLRVRHVFSRAP